MPEVIVRKRTGKRTGNVSYRLHRWYYRHRPQVAVVVAFLVFAVAGYLVAKALLPSTTIPPPTTEAPPPT